MDPAAKQLEQLNQEIAAVTIEAKILWKAYERARGAKLEAKRLRRWEQLIQQQKDLAEERKELATKLAGPGVHTPLMTTSQRQPQSPWHESHQHMQLLCFASYRVWCKENVVTRLGGV